MSSTPLPPAALLATVALSSLMLSSCSQDADAPVEPKPSAHERSDEPASANAWFQLRELVDQYPSQSGLFTTSPIATSLQTLLGEKFETFQTNFQVETPLQADGETLYTSGNRPAAGGSDQAYLLISPKSHSLEVGLWENGKLTTYRTQGISLTKPEDIQTLISNSAN